jgi:hypothetical protein
MTGGEPADAARDGRCACKVGRTAGNVGVRNLDDELRERHREGASLRDLERFVNRRILERALENAAPAVIGDVDAIYDALAGDDVSAGRRTEVRQRLAGAGVDVDRLLDEFVSYGTVRTHLRECLDVETDRRTELSVEDARGTIEWARSRSNGIVERTLERLVAADEVAGGDLSVSGTVRVTCDGCGASLPVEEFLATGGCACGPSGSG